jgi:hypothetical protein
MQQLMATIFHIRKGRLPDRIILSFSNDFSSCDPERRRSSANGLDAHR